MMKHLLRRARPGGDTHRSENSEQSKKEDRQSRMFANETSSVVSGLDEPPSHTPPAQYIGGPEVSKASGPGVRFRGSNSVPAKQNNISTTHQLGESPHLKLLAEYFPSFPNCDSENTQKLLVSSEHYFRLALESYEQLRAVHYRASQRFTLAEWLHIHALLLYGRIQQVQATADEKSGINQHNKIDLGGDIKVFAPIATALAAIGTVKDCENGILYIPDAIFPERPSSDAAYSTSEMQNILDGTLYDWQRSWGRVLEARSEREDNDTAGAMTRSSSELMLAIRETANSIDKIRAKKMTIEEEDESSEFVIQLARKERNLSQLFEEARNAKDYTICPPCNQVYSCNESFTSSSAPALNPVQSHDILKHPQNVDTLEVKPKRYVPPPLNLQKTRFTTATTSKYTPPKQHSAVTSPRSPQALRRPNANLDARPALMNKQPSPNVIAEYNKHYPKLYTDRAVLVSAKRSSEQPQSQQAQRMFNEHAEGAGTPKLLQSRMFNQELFTQIPTNTTRMKGDGSGASRRLGSLRQQYNNQIAFVPNAETHLYRPMHLKSTGTETHRNKMPAMGTSSDKTNGTPAESQHVAPGNIPTTAALNQEENISAPPMSEPSDIPTKGKASIDTRDADFKEAESPLLTPPDTSIDSDTVSLIANDDEFTAELSEGMEEEFASLKLNPIFFDAQSTTIAENLSQGEISTTDDDSRKDEASEKYSLNSVEDSASLHSNYYDSIALHSPIDQEEISRNFFAIQSPLLANRRFGSPIESPSSSAFLVPSASTSRKGPRKVTIGGSSDSLDQFVHYDAQLWSDYMTFVSNLQDSKLAVFDSMPSQSVGNLSWMLPVKVDHRSPEKEITMMLPFKSVSKEEQALGLLLQTCHVRQQPVQSWHNKINISVDLRNLMSRYVAAAVDDRTR